MTRDPDLIELLSKTLWESPHLPGAACVGHAELFDAAAQDEAAIHSRARHDAALELCQACPARAPCEQWIESRHPTWVTGIVAGTSEHTRRERKKGTA